MTAVAINEKTPKRFPYRVLKKFTAERLHRPLLQIDQTLLALLLKRMTAAYRGNLRPGLRFGRTISVRPVFRAITENEIYYINEGATPNKTIHEHTAQKRPKPLPLIDNGEQDRCATALPRNARLICRRAAGAANRTSTDHSRSRTQTKRTSCETYPLISKCRMAQTRTPTVMGVSDLL